MIINNAISVQFTHTACQLNFQDTCMMGLYIYIYIYRRMLILIKAYDKN